MGGGGEPRRSGGHRPGVCSLPCHPRPPPWGPPRALERGGPRWRAVLRGGGGRAPMRAPPLPAPRQGSGLPGCLPHPPHSRGRGVPCTASGRRGRGVESVPPPRPHLLGAGLREPAAGTAAEPGWGPPPSARRSADTRLAPSPPLLALGAGAHGTFSSGPECSTPRRRAAPPRAPPPASGVGGARPVPPPARVSSEPVAGE